MQGKREFQEVLKMKVKREKSCLTDTRSFVITQAIVEEKDMIDDELVITLKDKTGLEIVYTMPLWLNNNERLDQLEDATSVDVIEEDKVYPERLVKKEVDVVIATTSTWKKAFVVGIYAKDFKSCNEEEY